MISSKNVVVMRLVNRLLNLTDGSAHLINMFRAKSSQGVHSLILPYSSAVRTRFSAHHSSLAAFELLEEYLPPLIRDSFRLQSRARLVEVKSDSGDLIPETKSRQPGIKRSLDWCTRVDRSDDLD